MSEEQYEGLSPLGVIEVVSIEDPALDVVSMGEDAFLEYGRTRNPTLLQFLPGSKPTWYALRPLKRAALDGYVEAVDYYEERWIRSLLCCLDGIRDAVDPETGETITAPNPWRPAESLFNPQMTREHLKHYGTRIWPRKETIEMIQPAGARVELGKLCYDRAQLHPKERGASDPPHGSLSRVASRLRRAAAKEEAKPIEESSTTSSSTGSGGTTDATAPMTTGVASPLEASP